MHEALNNCGSALFEQRRIVSPEEAAALYAEASNKFQAASEIRPGSSGALFNWGIALLHLSETKKAEEGDRLFALASQKIETGHSIEPNNYEAFNTWSMGLINQAKRKNGKEFERVLEQAREKALRAESISEGSGAYNLACVSALRGEGVEAQKWLEKAQEHGTLPDQEHLEKDSGLDSVREREWFRDILETL